MFIDWFYAASRQHSDQRARPNKPIGKYCNRFAFNSSKITPITPYKSLPHAINREFHIQIDTILSLFPQPLKNFALIHFSSLSFSGSSLASARYRYRAASQYSTLYARASPAGIAFPRHVRRNSVEAAVVAAASLLHCTTEIPRRPYCTLSREAKPGRLELREPLRPEACARFEGRCCCCCAGERRVRQCAVVALISHCFIHTHTSASLHVQGRRFLQAWTVEARGLNVLLRWCEDWWK